MAKSLVYLSLAVLITFACKSKRSLIDVSLPRSKSVLNQTQFKLPPPVDPKELRVRGLTFLKLNAAYLMSVDVDDRADSYEYEICPKTSGLACKESGHTPNIEELIFTPLTGVLSIHIRACVRPERVLGNQGPCGPWFYWDQTFAPSSSASSHMTQWSHDLQAFGLQYYAEMQNLEKASCLHKQVKQSFSDNLDLGPDIIAFSFLYPTSLESRSLIVAGRELMRFQFVNKIMEEQLHPVSLGLTGEGLLADEFSSDQSKYLSSDELYIYGQKLAGMKTEYTQLVADLAKPSGTSGLNQALLNIPVNKNFIAIPQHTDGNHWTAWLIDKKKNKIFYFDSLGIDLNTRNFSTTGELKQSFPGFAIETVNTSLGENRTLVGADTIVEQIPMQKSGFQCGVHVEHFFAYMANGGDADQYRALFANQDDWHQAMDGFRHHMGEQVYEQKYRTQENYRTAFETNKSKLLGGMDFSTVKAVEEVSGSKLTPSPSAVDGAQITFKPTHYPDPAPAKNVDAEPGIDSRISPQVQAASPVVSRTPSVLAPAPVPNKVVQSDSSKIPASPPPLPQKIPDVEDIPRVDYESNAGAKFVGFYGLAVLTLSVATMVQLTSCVEQDKFMALAKNLLERANEIRASWEKEAVLILGGIQKAK